LKGHQVELITALGVSVDKKEMGKIKKLRTAGSKKHFDEDDEHNDNADNNDNDQQNDNGDNEGAVAEVKATSNDSNTSNNNNADNEADEDDGGEDEADGDDANKKRKRKRKRKSAADSSNADGSKPASSSSSSAGASASGPVKENAFVNSQTLYIEGLPFSATDDDVRRFFKDYGTVVSVRLPRWHDSGRLRGYGHVEFATAEAAKKAFELDGTSRL
jgi:nucleolin